MKNNKKTVREESLVEAKRVSVHILNISSELECNIQNQQNKEIKSDEENVENNPINQDPLVDYQLAKDREKRPSREPAKLV